MGQDTSAAAPVDLFEEALQRRLVGRVRDLHVEFHGQGLVLRGWSRTYYAKQLAQHAAMEVTGLQILANEIVVQ